MVIDGDNILYHYFRDELMKKETEESRMLIQHMIKNLSIWLPIKLYKKIPVLLPFSIRDHSCRKSVNKKLEEWGSCDANGYFRDDNTLIKAIPRRFRIVSKNRAYAKQKMGKGFVASHIWRKLSYQSELASKNPLTNTFVPNLVWLPRQISKLTDREGSFAQRYLQGLSISIYRNVELTKEKYDFIKHIWNNLPVPAGITVKEDEKNDLNFFEMSEKDVEKRVKLLLDQIELIKNPLPKKKLYCSRYFATYSMLPKKTKSFFIDKLTKYSNIVG